MSICDWLLGLFGKPNRVTEEDLRRRLIALDQQQARWTQRAREAERLKNEAFMKGAMTQDPREKLECARRVKQLDRDMKQFDANAAVLEQRKDMLSTWIRAIQAGEVAPTREEVNRAEAAISELTAQDERLRAELEQAATSVAGLESGRLDTPIQESQDVEEILRAMDGSRAESKRDTGIEKQKE